MAFGFQNCCDSNEYFYVNNIPNTVSEYEVYYIDTLEDWDRAEILASIVIKNMHNHEK